MDKLTPRIFAPLIACKSIICPTLETNHAPSHITGLSKGHYDTHGVAVAMSLSA
ncbi:MAG: hypothetical protein ISR72_06455 [Methylobacter sp.]|nr:hypothetical protein [Methylobacter sp.]